MPRLASGLVVQALLWRVFAAGGAAAVLVRGEATAGGILVLIRERGGNPCLYEAGLGAAGTTELLRVGPDSGDEEAVEAYWRRRRTRDPDLWVIELDGAEAERFAAEIILNR